MDSCASFTDKVMQSYYCYASTVYATLGKKLVSEHLQYFVDKGVHTSLGITS